MENVDIPVAEAMNVETTRDGMLAIVSFSEPENGGDLLSCSEMLQELEQKGITAGVKNDVLEELLKSKKYHYKYIVAQGVPAQDGKDAIINLRFNPEEIDKVRPKEKLDGTVDFKNLDNIRNVKKGDILAERIPATEGVEGYNIWGIPIRAKRGREYRLPIGKNTRISEDGLRLIALEDGKLEYEGGRISISTVCQIAGDVDHSTGNIDFIGSVIIGGSVHDGFIVKAKGSIEIKGPVEGATLIAGGDIILSFGIQGNLESKLQAGGSVIAKFIQNANVQADGDIVAEGIWNSVVNAGGVVKVDIGKGSIMGGKIIATNVVSAKNIGSSMGVITDIQTGITPSVFKDYKLLEEIISNKSKELSNIEKEIIFIKARSIGTLMDHIKKARLEKLIIQRKTILEFLEEHKKRYAHLTKRIQNVTEGAIKVKDKIYPGTRLIIGSISKEILVEEQYCTFRKEGTHILSDIYEAGNKGMSIVCDENCIERVDDGLYIKEMGVTKYQKEKALQD